MLDEYVDRKIQPYYNSARSAPAGMLGLYIVTCQATGIIIPIFPGTLRSAGEHKA